MTGPTDRPSQTVAAEGAGAPAPAAPVGRVALLLGTLVALTVIGASAVAVALPTVGREFGLDTAGTAWVLASFSLTFAVGTAIFGRLADLRGLRTPLILGVALLAAGSVMAAAAWSYPVLLAARLVQGAGAGAVPVLSVGILSARFDEDMRGRALGGLTAVVAVVSGSGPLIGGMLGEFLGWRAVVAVPVLALALVVPVIRLAPARPRAPGRLDVRGALLVAATAGGVVVLLQAPATGGNVPVAAGAGLLAVGGAGALARHVRLRPAGMVPRVLIGNRRLLLTSGAGLTLLAAYLGMLLALPLLLSRQSGYRPLQIGIILLPAAACGAVVSQVVGTVAARAGRQRVAATLALASAGGMLLAGIRPQSPVALVIGMALVASGFAGGQTALLDSIPGLVDPGVQGIAIGLFNLVFFTGGAVGTAAVGGLADPLGLPVALACVASLPACGALAAFAARR